MRELFLHVGMHKTGTSSIQRTLDGHRAALQAAGFSYFQAEEPNHTRAVVSAFAETPERHPAARLAGLHEAGQAAAYAAAIRARLCDFLSAAPGPNLVLSGEGIGTQGAAAIRRMLATFRPLVDRITVVGFVRPPRAYINSAAQSRIRLGATLEVLKRRGLAPHYRERFEPFLAAREVAEVRLLPYVRGSLHRGCSVAAFLKAIGAPDALYDGLTVDRANTASGRAGLVLSLALNDAVPFWLPDGRRNPVRAKRLTNFLGRMEGERFALPEAILAPLLEAAAEDVAWMEARLGQPFPPEPPEPVPAVADLRSLGWAELKMLAKALNDLLREPAGPSPARERRSERAGAREARQAARRAARQAGRPVGRDLELPEDAA